MHVRTESLERRVARNQRGRFQRALCRQHSIKGIAVINSSERKTTPALSNRKTDRSRQV
jgi:hypothetical protein